MATKIINTEIAYNGECFDIVAFPNVNTNLLEIAYNGEIYAGTVYQAPPKAGNLIYYNTIQKIGILIDKITNKIILKT